MEMTNSQKPYQCCRNLDCPIQSASLPVLMAYLSLSSSWVFHSCKHDLNIFEPFKYHFNIISISFQYHSNIMTSNSSNMIQWHPPASWQDLDLFTALLYSDGLDVEGALRRGCGRVEPTLDFEDFDQILGEYLMALWFCVSCWIEMIMYHNII